MVNKHFDADAVRRQISRLRNASEFRGSAFRLWGSVFEVSVNAGCFQRPEYSELLRYLEHIKAEHPDDLQRGRRFMVTTIAWLRNRQSWLPNSAICHLPEDLWPKGEWPMFGYPPEEWVRSGILAFSQVLAAEIEEQEIEAKKGDRGGESSRDLKVSHNDERDKWRYEKATSGMEYPKIIAELKAVAASSGWTIISTTPGIKKAATAYCDRRRLPAPPTRQPGRKKTKPK